MTNRRQPSLVHPGNPFWMLGAAALLFWPAIEWGTGTAGIWATGAWWVFLLAAGFALHAVKPRRRG
jgi:hypothetical protein